MCNRGLTKLSPLESQWNCVAKRLGGDNLKTFNNEDQCSIIDVEIEEL